MIRKSNIMSMRKGPIVLFLFALLSANYLLSCSEKEKEELKILREFDKEVQASVDRRKAKVIQ